MKLSLNATDDPGSTAPDHLSVSSNAQRSDDGAEASWSPGRCIGRFLLRRVLGRGGMGVVVAAWDPVRQAEVALKIPRRSPRHPDGSRLLREARAMSLVDDPHVVRLLEVGGWLGAPFLVMELIDGGTLAARLQHGQDPPETVLRRLIEVASGLVALHHVGLVHRDVKSTNILVGADGRARLGDLGLAVPTTIDANREPEDARSRGLVVGTPRSMAPEQLRAGPVDARADQFAFCLMAWRALEGVDPFGPAVEPASRLQEIRERHRAVQRMASGEPVREALAVGLAPDPDARHPSMAMLRAALEAARGRGLRSASMGDWRPASELDRTDWCRPAPAALDQTRPA